MEQGEEEEERVTVGVGGKTVGERRGREVNREDKMGHWGTEEGGGTRYVPQT